MIARSNLTTRRHNLCSFIFNSSKLRGRRSKKQRQQHAVAECSTRFASWALLENDLVIGLQSILSRNTGCRLMFRFAMTFAGFYKAACKKLQVFSFFFFDRIRCVVTISKEGGEKDEDSQQIVSVCSSCTRTAVMVWSCCGPGRKVQLPSGNRFLEVQNLQIGPDTEGRLPESNSRWPNHAGY